MESRAENARARSLGRSAERLAEAWLRRRGLVTVTRNYRCRHGEIDLVMLDDGVLVFVEVRCRRGRSLTPAALTVDRPKQRRLTATAMRFIAAHPEFVSACTRFDVIGFDGGTRTSSPGSWVRNAFEPDSAAFGR